MFGNRRNPPFGEFLCATEWGISQWGFMGERIDDIPRLADIVKPSIISLNPCLTSISKSTRKKKKNSRQTLIMKGRMHSEHIGIHTIRCWWIKKLVKSIQMIYHAQLPQFLHQFTMTNIFMQTWKYIFYTSLKSRGHDSKFGCHLVTTTPQKQSRPTHHFLSSRIHLWL